MKGKKLEPIDYKQYPILFVDDEEENLDIFTINFGDTFTIYTATNGSRGLEVLDKESVSLVLSDQRMAGMTGMEFLQEVRIRHPEILLMLVTAYSDLDVLADGVTAGLLHSYIVKPWEVKDLKMVLTRGIEHYFLASERDRLHREQIETLQKMARANRLSAVGTLAAGVAHEIRNPLVTIQTFLEMVPLKLAELGLSHPGGLDKEFWEEFYSLSFSEIKRISALISELVNFSRSSPPKFSEVEISEVVRPMVDLIRKEAQKLKITTGYHEEPNLPSVMIDASQIKQVLLNILLNALQSSHEGGEIEVYARTVDVRERGPILQVIVRDNGEGIAREIQEQLFDPFFTTKNPGEGVGLGLTICHQIMEEHGGGIEMKSEPGKGTEVVLTFSRNGRKRDGL